MRERLEATTRPTEGQASSYLRAYQGVSDFGDVPQLSDPTQAHPGVGSGLL